MHAAFCALWLTRLCSPGWTRTVKSLRSVSAQGGEPIFVKGSTLALSLLSVARILFAAFWMYNPKR